MPRQRRINWTPTRRRTFQPELAAAWKQAHERGIAGDLCDRIIRTRELPDQLLKALAPLDREAA